MKSSLKVSMLLCSLILAGCGEKKATSSALISEEYKSTLDNFYAEVNPSTLDLEKLSDLPKRVDLKDVMTPVKDQGDRGTCTFFVAMALTESAIKRKMKIDVNLSEEYSNYSTKADGYASNREASSTRRNLRAAVINKKGFLLERDWPYQPSWFGAKAPCIENEAGGKDTPKECYSHNAPSEKIMEQLISGDNFVTEGEEITTTNDLIKTLADSKMPVGITMPMNPKGWGDDGVVQYTKELRQECLDTPSECGSHAVTITGYDMDKKVFFIRNSWGKKWGQNGYGTIPFEVIDLYAYIDSSASIKLKEDISLPSDYKQSYLSFNSFGMVSEQAKDNSVKIQTTGSIKNAGIYTISVASTLVKRMDSMKGDLTDENTERVRLSDADSESNSNQRYISEWQDSYSDPDLKDRTWTLADSTFSFSANVMNSSSVQKFAPIYSNLFVRTTLYVYTDDQQYKVLKRVYHSMNYEN